MWLPLRSVIFVSRAGDALEKSSFTPDFRKVSVAVPPALFITSAPEPGAVANDPLPRLSNRYSPPDGPRQVRSPSDSVASVLSAPSHTTQSRPAVRTTPPPRPL